MYDCFWNLISWFLARVSVVSITIVSRGMSKCRFARPQMATLGCKDMDHVAITMLIALASSLLGLCLAPRAIKLRLDAHREKVRPQSQQ